MKETDHRGTGTGERPTGERSERTRSLNEFYLDETHSNQLILKEIQNFVRFDIFY